MNQKTTVKKLAISMAIIVAVFVFASCSQKQPVEQNNQQSSNQNQQQVQQGNEMQEKQETETTEIDTSDWQTYRNEEIGITFKYPKEWGVIEEWRDQGCFNYEKKSIDKSLLTNEDSCLQIGLKASNLSPEGALFLATQSPLRVKYPAPRGGYWGDKTGIIESEDFVKNFCKETKSENCEILTTKNGITVAKNKEQKDFAPEGELIDVYYIKSTHPIYFGIIMSPDRLKFENQNNSENNFMGVMNTMLFLQ